MGLLRRFSIAMARGTMKTNYWLIFIAAGAAVGLTVYLRSSGEKSMRPAPPRVPQVRHHVRELELPPPAPPPAESTVEPLVSPVATTALTPPPPEVPPVAVPVPSPPAKPGPSPLPPIVPISATQPPAPAPVPGPLPELKIPPIPQSAQDPAALTGAASEPPLLPEPPGSTGASPAGS
jgi:hypothetical protein